MGLVEQNRAEKRARILRTARRLIAARGYEQVTIRDLAQTSRVSVPTLYSLFPSKEAILLAELEIAFAEMASRVSASSAASPLQRALDMLDASMAEMTAMPEHYREVIHYFLASPEAAATRQRIDRNMVATMAAILRASHQAGELAEWVDPEALSAQGYASSMSWLLSWGFGDLDDEGLRSATIAGFCMTVLGVARGTAAAAIERKLRELQPALKCRRQS